MITDREGFEIVSKDAAREAYTRYRNEEAEKAVGAADERARRETMERVRAEV